MEGEKGISSLQTTNCEDPGSCARPPGEEALSENSLVCWDSEKVILRWRRRGAGLRGFRPTENAVTESTSSSSGNVTQNRPAENDYDFLQEGRKQTEERLQKALARVKSMVQYPEARDQYQRILNVVSKMQESQTVQEKILDESTEMDEGDFMSEFKELWDDDTPLPGYF